MRLKQNKNRFIILEEAIDGIRQWLNLRYFICDDKKFRNFFKTLSLK